MKLRNKKTGEIRTLYFEDDVFKVVADDGAFYRLYETLSKLYEEWQDYEEPKGSALNLTILTLTNFIENEPDEDKVDLDDCKQLLEKLKAWERLKDKGLHFTTFYVEDGSLVIRARIYNALWAENWEDLDLLFSGDKE